MFTFRTICRSTNGYESDAANSLSHDTKSEAIDYATRLLATWIGEPDQPTIYVLDCRTGEETPITLEEESVQTYQIRTTVTADNDENDQLSHTIDEESYPHDEPLGPRDFPSYGELIDSETDPSGRFTMMVFNRFDQDYDRNAEEYYPVIVETVVRRIA